MCPVYKLTNYVKPILSIYNISNTGYYFYNVLWHITGNKVNTMQCILLYGLIWILFVFILGISITNILSDNDINWSDIKELIKLGKQSMRVNKAICCFHP